MAITCLLLFQQIRIRMHLLMLTHQEFNNFNQVLIYLLVPVDPSFKFTDRGLMSLNIILNDFCYNLFFLFFFNCIKFLLELCNLFLEDLQLALLVLYHVNTQRIKASNYDFNLLHDRLARMGSWCFCRGTRQNLSCRSFPIK